MNLFKVNKKEDFIDISKAYIFSRIIFIGLLLLFSIPRGLDKNLLNFDIEHYLNIALDGYLNNSDYAFFPLLPLLMRFFDLFKVPTLGIVVLNLFLSYLTTIILYKIVKEIYNYDDKTVKNIILFWLFSPIALFTIIPYTEGIFIFLTMFTFYLYKIGKYPVLMGIALGLSVFTRSFGAMLFFSIFIVLFKDLCENFKISFKKDFIYILNIYIPATFISIVYPIYLYIKKGDFLYFLNVQFSEWYRVKSNIFSMLIEDFKLIFNNETIILLSTINLMILFIVLFYTIIFFVKSIANKEEDSLILGLYTLFCFISCFSTMRVDGGTMASCSIYRYLLSLFPLYIYRKNDVMKSISLRIFIILNIIIILCFCLNIFLC